MRALTTSVAWLALGLGLVLGGPGCGGGGAGPGAPVDPAALFAGTYGFMSFGANASPPGSESWSAGWGTVDADGVGEFDAATWANVEGTQSSSSTPGLDYTVDAARVWRWHFPSAPGNELVQGGITADGSVVGGAVHPAAADPAWLVLVRRGGAAFTNASLSGRYRIGSILFSAGSGSCSVHHGYIDFDGLGPPGDAAGVVRENEGGVVSLPGTIIATYTVAATGAVTMNFPFGLALQGTLLAGGDLLVLSGFDAGVPASPWALVLVRESSGVTDATLTGNYFALGFSDRLTSGLYACQTGTIAANGAGNFTINWTEHQEGTSVPVSTAATYATMPDGRLHVTKTGGETLEGGVSGDGRFAVVAGGRVAGEDPELWFLFR